MLFRFLREFNKIYVVTHILPIYQFLFQLQKAYVVNDTDVTFKLIEPIG